MMGTPRQSRPVKAVADGSKAPAGVAPWIKEKPPVLGRLQRGQQVIMRLLENVQQKTIEPLIRATVCPGTQMDTDEYDIDARLRDWGFVHSTVCRGQGEYARDEDGDGFDEVHVNTIEGFWSLLRSWLRPPSGDLPREAAVVPGLLPVRAQYLDTE